VTFCPYISIHETNTSFFQPKFTHFNAIQTQAFHTLFHQTCNVLLGAPTGSGKTISAELAMLQVFRDTPDRKVVYIAPLKALVRERVSDWRKNLCPTLNKKLVELTGDYTPDLRSLLSADIIVWYALRFPNPTHTVLPKLVTVVHASRYTRTRRDVLPLLIQDVNHFSCTKTAPPRSGTGFRGTGARGRTSRKSRWWWYALRVSQNPARRLFYLSAGDCSDRLQATVRTDYGRLFVHTSANTRPIHD
jgi:hypothetical protein